VPKIHNSGSLGGHVSKNSAACGKLGSATVVSQSQRLIRNWIQQLSYYLNRIGSELGAVVAHIQTFITFSYGFLGLEQTL
jgi:hypothetical protein